jgi:AmmeMemoRadiSam system protein B
MIRASRVLIPFLLISMASHARPTLEEVRREMGTPSSGDVRGQRDIVGYARTPEAMARVWDLADGAPAPESFGETVAPGIVGAIGPHDDYIYTARTYRKIFPLVTAQTVVLVGVFHRYRRFEARDQIVFDSYRAWRSPDGEIAVSPLREDLLRELPSAMAVRDDAAHDIEHSLEGIAYFLKHARSDVQIVPLLVPAASYEKLAQMAAELSRALASVMKKRDWALGRDIAIVISADGTHYGEDFHFTPYGAGGVKVFERAMEDDRRLIRETLSGLFTEAKGRAFFSTVVDPADPDTYRRPWCGRFSVPFGAMLVDGTAKALGMRAPRAVPIALGVSVDTPELAVRDLGMGATAPANLYHFVTHPAIAFVE